MTHNLSFYITLNLDFHMSKIQTADNTIFKTQEAGNINLPILIQNKHI